jgi:hypothetical protein
LNQSVARHALVRVSAAQRAAETRQIRKVQDLSNTNFDIKLQISSKGGGVHHHEGGHRPLHPFPFCASLKRIGTKTVAISKVQQLSEGLASNRLFALTKVQLIQA